MEKVDGTIRQEYTIRILFVAAVALVIVLSVISSGLHGSMAPSVKKGATEAEVESYAYQLLRSDNGISARGYQDATSYYLSQIDLASTSEQKFDLSLDLATFYGETGDPRSGLSVLDGIDVAGLSPDSHYYLCATYAYLYGRLGDSEAVARYQQEAEAALSDPSSDEVI